jgi:prepilin-type N-terminal cleavage/methylation domain-containing protein
MRRNRDRAFTLIEVMAAVFMLGLFVAAISQLLTQARRNEGYARLQAHATELADRAVAEIEEGLARGAAPPLGERETGDGDWIVTTAVTPFDATTLAAAAAADPHSTPATKQAPAGSWLESPAAKANPPLLEIAVRVSWKDAPVDAETQQPFAIRRRTFALNPAALEGLSDADADAESGPSGGDAGAAPDATDPEAEQ